MRRMTPEESKLVIEASRVLNEWKEILHISEPIYVKIADVVPIRGMSRWVEYKIEDHTLLIDPRANIQRLDLFIGRELIYRLLIQHFKKVWLGRLKNELMSSDCGGWLLLRFPVLQKMGQEGQDIEVVHAVGLIGDKMKKEFKEIMYVLALKIYNLYKDQEGKEEEKEEEK